MKCSTVVYALNPCKLLNFRDFGQKVPRKSSFFYEWISWKLLVNIGEMSKIYVNFEKHHCARAQSPSSCSFVHANVRK